MMARTSIHNNRSMRSVITEPKSQLQWWSNLIAIEKYVITYGCPNLCAGLGDILVEDAILNDKSTYDSKRYVNPYNINPTMHTRQCL